MNYKDLWLTKVVFLIVLLLSIGIVVYGCAAPTEDAVPDEGYIDREVPADYDDREVSRGDSPVEDAGIYKISRAEVNLEVEDLDNSISSLEEKARDLEGFVSYSSINKRERDPSAQVTLRVPADKFYVMLEEIEKVGDVKHRSTSEEDVTRRYIDLEARLNNLTSQEKRLTEIMEMAETVEDVLSVEKELERVRGEIEALTGELNYLKSQVNMSTINISLKETTLAATGVTGVDFGDMFTRGYYSFIDSINSLILFAHGFVVFLMGAIPYLIIFALLFFVLRKPYSYLKEKRKERKTPPDKPVQS